MLIVASDDRSAELASSGSWGGLIGAVTCATEEASKSGLRVWGGARVWVEVVRCVPMVGVGWGCIGGRGDNCRTSGVS